MASLYSLLLSVHLWSKLLFLYLSAVCVVAWCGSIGVFGTGSPLPPFLLFLAVLPSQEEPGLSQCGLLLHRLVCDHRHARVQVCELNTKHSSPHNVAIHVIHSS